MANKTLSLLFSNQASLRHYKTPEQQMFIKANVVESLALMLSLLNIGKNMDKRQIEATAQLLIEEEAFKILCPAEIREAISRGVRGNYGKLFDVCDLPTIFGWVHSYIAERFDAIERYREQETSELRANMNKPMLALAKLNLQKPAEGERAKQPHREKTAPELELDDYLQEFQKLWESQPENQKYALKVVEYKKQLLEVSQYCNLRWEEARIEL